MLAGALEEGEESESAPVDREDRVVKQIAEPGNGDGILVLGDLHLESDTLLERGVDVDGVGEGFGIEITNDVLVVELGAVGAGDGEGKERVEVDGEEGAELSGREAGNIGGEEDD